MGGSEGGPRPSACAPASPALPGSSGALLSTHEEETRLAHPAVPGGVCSGAPGAGKRGPHRGTGGPISLCTRQKALLPSLTSCIYRKDFVWTKGFVPHYDPEQSQKHVAARLLIQ